MLAQVIIEKVKLKTTSFMKNAAGKYDLYMASAMDQQLHVYLSLNVKQMPPQLMPNNSNKIVYYSTWKHEIY